MATATDMLSRLVQLSNGLTTPQIHLGLYMMSGPETTRAVRSALDIGYRGFDCAQWYYNEREAGAAIRAFIAASSSTPAPVSRDDIFYTTKLRDNSTSYDAVRKSIRRSVAACGLGHIDLFLLHSPHGGREARLASWRAVEDAVLAGEVRMGGVSNFGVRHVEELMAAGPRVCPVVNQIEVHPFNTQTAIRDVCAKHGIVVEAYAPLARAMRFGHPTVVEMSKAYGCTPAQLLLRWSIQHGFVTLPKSVKQARLVANADVGGFEISNQDLEVLDGLDEKLVTDWDPTDAP
ncbi:NADP-dependent oxidoreductase domain-containing protein [Lasiosphaeris hirsuta]|uniref:NADP-dependent oxidoreductase domain-containing protein n=1 Tax=Lasiosphaeris hirsuta TaxID=260670 RepID=A0AA40AQM7_9PEZI|nr:NADP-dependent oxidoreductase domain-containing protein [Lasiosphaeris hirsuta]